MNRKFKVGDRVELKPNPKTFSLPSYGTWGIYLHTVYTVVKVSESGSGIKLDNGCWASDEDMEISFSEMLRKVLE